MSQNQIKDDLKIENSNWMFFVFNLIIANENIVQFVLFLFLIAFWQVSSFYNWQFANLIQSIVIVVFISQSLKSLELKSEFTNLFKIIILASVFAIGSVFLIIDDRNGFMPWNLTFWMLLFKYYTSKINFLQFYILMISKIKNINKYRKINKDV